MNRLRLRFEAEDQWHGKLNADVSANGFFGCGEAWFSTDELRSFAERIAAFPLPADGPSIAGGFGDRQGGLEQTHVSVLVEQHDARGTVIATVHLATAVWRNEQADLAQSLTARLFVTYGDLGSFAASICPMLDGKEAEALLTSSV